VYTVEWTPISVSYIVLESCQIRCQSVTTTIPLDIIDNKYEESITQLFHKFTAKTNDSVPCPRDAKIVFSICSNKLIIYSNKLTVKHFESTLSHVLSCGSVTLRSL